MPGTQWCPSSESLISCEDINESVRSGVSNLSMNTTKEVTSLAKELYVECVPDCSSASKGVSAAAIWKTVREYIHVPYFPAFHRPGWLLRYVVGPYDALWMENFFADVFAGISVALLLIPQALSYATLANLPPVNGLYCAVLPSAVYTFFGSSLQLAVGPVAIVSLLMGELVSKYKITPGSPESVDFAAEVCVCMGTILTVLSILNVGNFIRYISFPVMSGFTSAAASLIGMNQIKNMFGFTTPYYPQTGDGIMHENYEVMQWIVNAYNSVTTLAPSPAPSFQPTDSTGSYVAVPTRAPTAFTATTAKKLIKNAMVVRGEGKSVLNPYAIAICFGLWASLALINTMKKRFKPTPERKKNWCFYIWSLLANISPFFAIIIGAGIASKLKIDDKYPDDINHWSFTLTGAKWTLTNPGEHSYYVTQLKTVGDVASGINILRTPSMKYDFGLLLMDTIPLTLIAFMESYSVARKMAAIRNELHILNASQELWAVGIANLLGAVSSAYPVAGSFSRSSLNLASGARTPLSKAVCLTVVLLTLGVLTGTFYYIPQAALAAVIMASISSLIDIRDFWNTWKYSKKDFFLMVWTSAFTFIFDTQWGLLAGIGLSIVMYLGEFAFRSVTAPTKLFSNHSENDGIEVVNLESDLVFLNSGRIKDFLMSLITQPVEEVDKETADRSEYLFWLVSSSFDRTFSPNLIKSVNSVLPAAVVVDFTCVHIIDITGMQSLAEFVQSARAVNVLVVLINTSPEVTAALTKFGLKSDGSSQRVQLDEYTEKSDLPILRHGKEAYESAKLQGKLPHEDHKSASTPFTSSIVISDGLEDLERPARVLTEDEWEEVNGGRVRRNSVPNEIPSHEYSRVANRPSVGRKSVGGKAPDGTTALVDESSIELQSTEKV